MDNWLQNPPRRPSMTPDGMRNMTEKIKKAEDKPASKNNKLSVSIPKYEIQTQRINK